MPMTVQHDKQHNELHLIFRDDKLIWDQEWFAPNAFIELSADGTPVGITFVTYYTQPKWSLTEEHVKKYHLEEYLDDLRLVYKAFFEPQLSIKRIETNDGVVWGNP
jgi:hypothetical protein